MLKSTPGVNSNDPSATDPSDVRTLFEAEESKLLRYAFSLIGRRAVAEDVVQDVFLQLHAKWEEVESPRAWLYRSVRNRAFNHLRKSKREVLQGDDDVSSTNSESVENAPDNHLARMEEVAAIRQLLGQLEERDRELVKLKYFEGLKYREISEKTGLTISNVGYRLHHILKNLASGLQPLGIDELS